MFMRSLYRRSDNAICQSREPIVRRALPLNSCFTSDAVTSHYSARIPAAADLRKSLSRNAFPSQHGKSMHRSLGAIVGWQKWPFFGSGSWAPCGVSKCDASCWHHGAHYGKPRADLLRESTDHRTFGFVRLTMCSHANASVQH